MGRHCLSLFHSSIHSTILPFGRLFSLHSVLVNVLISLSLIAPSSTAAAIDLMRAIATGMLIGGGPMGSEGLVCSWELCSVGGGPGGSGGGGPGGSGGCSLLLLGCCVSGKPCLRPLSSLSC